MVSFSGQLDTLGRGNLNRANCLHQRGPGACLWGKFSLLLTNGRVQPTVAQSIPGKVSLNYMRKVWNRSLGASQRVGFLHGLCFCSDEV